MSYVKCLKCVSCCREHSAEETKYVCLSCGSNLDVIYDFDSLSKIIDKEKLKDNTDKSIWRYSQILPVEDRAVTFPLQIGWTPIYKSERLNNFLGLDILFVKDDGRNPTASFKDRASAIGVVKALELGVDTLTCASTGNAASSLAGLSASVGLKNYIFVPQTAPKAKVAQLLVFGAKVIMVKGTYDQAFDLCLAASKKFGWYCRNTGYNPYMSEGKKTAALEICEQLNWEVPDRVFVSVGDGCIIGGMWKGFKDFYELGFIDNLPQMIGVQAEGSAPLVVAFHTNEDVKSVVPNTIADSISVGQPRDAVKALRAARDSHGMMISVSDDEILEAIEILAKYSGVFAEPAGAAGFAGLRKMLEEDKIDKGEKIVVMVTGNGLKDVDAVLRAVDMPKAIEPEMDEVEKLLVF